ncbi:MAG: DUF3261 domain-containing protein [Propionivibrio sp.]
MKPWHLLMLPLLLALVACQDDTRCAALIGGGNYCLQPTTDVHPFDVQQKADARFGDRRETMIAEIEVDAAGADVVALTPFGHTLLQVHYDNRQATAATLPDQRISPALLMALLQIAWWPADSLRVGLEAPATLEEGAGLRRIVNDGETTLSIAYEGEQPPDRRLRVSIPSADLVIDIETLPVVGRTQ